MASHNYQQFQYGLEKYPVTLYANIPIGTSGAVGTMVPAYNQGIYSVTRSSAGVYVVTFGVLPQSQIDKYYRVIDASAMILNATATSTRMEIAADNAASGSVTIRFVAPTSASDTTPVATDPVNGAVLLLKFILKNSSV